jgi:predicted phage terminase large subunit-like protein
VGLISGTGHIVVAQPQGKRGAIICDPAATAKTKADFSAWGAFAMQGYAEESRMFVLEIGRAQIEIPQLVRVLSAFQQRWGLLIGVEAVGGFKAVPQSLRDQDPTLRVIDIIPKGDKFTNAQPASSAWQDGRILVPLETAVAPWIKPYLDEMKKFTGLGDAHDDQVDITSNDWNLMYRKKPGRGANGSESRPDF